MSSHPVVQRVVSATLILAVGACSSATDVPTTPSEVAVAAGAPITASARAGQPVLSFADLSLVGSSSLNRTPNGVSYNVATTGLEPGHAYTLWIVIFNNTSGCLNGTPGFSNCGPNDVVNDAARPDMMLAGGHVVGGTTATFAGRRNVGDMSGSANAPVGVPAYGLENPSGAEFHFVVHDHGPKLAAYMPDMIQTIDGGCTDAGVPAAGVPSPWNDNPFGQRGPNTCVSVQFSVHAP